MSPEDRKAKTDSAVKSLLECGMYKGDTDPVECVIMKLGLDYEGALAIVSTLQAALEKRYDHCGLNDEVKTELFWLIKALSVAEEPEPDPKFDEDQIADDPRRL